jgi:hypothetical protein
MNKEVGNNKLIKEGKENDDKWGGVGLNGECERHDVQEEEEYTQ